MEEEVSLRSQGRNKKSQGKSKKAKVLAVLRALLKSQNIYVHKLISSTFYLALFIWLFLFGSFYLAFIPFQSKYPDHQHRNVRLSKRWCIGLRCQYW